MRFMTMLRAISLVSALAMALAVIGVSAVVPIPVDTSEARGWENGVYVQAVTERVFENGQAVGTQVAYCHVHVKTTVDGVGEVMTATDGENDYSAEVRRVFAPGTRDVVGGRATFAGLEPGTTLTTTNTSPVVSGTCPAS